VAVVISLVAYMIVCKSALFRKLERRLRVFENEVILLPPNRRRGSYCPPPLNIDRIHMFSQFQALVATFRQLNQVLLDCMPSIKPHLFVNGIFVHNVLQDMAAYMITSTHPGPKNPRTYVNLLFNNNTAVENLIAAVVKFVTKRADVF